MYIKRLIIKSKNTVIRDIHFGDGLNLILDNTPITFKTETGNNVGKTTVLQLIDFCLGASEDKITRDKESKSILYNVKSFLVDEEVVVTLILSNELYDSKNDIVIRRNFLARNKKIMEVNGQNLPQNKGELFFESLDELLFGKRKEMKPSLRQILAHNIRYSDERISNTLKMVSSHTTLSEYETLFLFMFGFNSSDRTPLIKSLQAEEKFKSRLTEEKDKTELELQLNIINSNIEYLSNKKDSLVINKDYEDDIKAINIYKSEITKLSTQISELQLRKELLIETKKELDSDYSDVSTELLENIYNQATTYNLSALQKKFKDIVKYHNEMILEKIRFITEDIPAIESNMVDLEKKLSDISAKKKDLDKKVKTSSTLKDLEIIITNLNEEYRKKGEIEKLVSQIEEVEKKISNINSELECVDGDIFTENFQKLLKEKLSIFNTYFSKVSKELYDEEYGVTFEIIKDKKSAKNVYRFKCFNNNTSSGKKQGEIICFDLAYILFARDYNIPHVDFILNDKKELMFGTQLVKVSEFAHNNKIQLVFSILRDKLPKQLDNDNNIVVELSQKDKLFRIETKGLPPKN